MVQYYIISALILHFFSADLSVGSNKISSNGNVALFLGQDRYPQALVATGRQKTPKQDTGTVITGIGCGMRRVKPGSLLQISTNNFPANYNNRDACEWKFKASDCTLTAACPTDSFDIPSSFNCLGDYLKISDNSHYNQKFCGENKPFGKYRSGSDQLSIKFKANAAETGKGFICYILCTPPGVADLTIPNPII